MMRLYLVKAEIKDGEEKSLLSLIEGNSAGFFLEFSLRDAKVNDGVVSFSSVSFTDFEEERKTLEKYFSIMDVSEIRGHYRLNGCPLLDYLRK